MSFEKLITDPKFQTSLPTIKATDFKIGTIYNVILEDFLHPEESPFAKGKNTKYQCWRGHLMRSDSKYYPCKIHLSEYSLLIAYQNLFDRPTLNPGKKYTIKIEFERTTKKSMLILRFEVMTEHSKTEQSIT